MIVDDDVGLVLNLNLIAFLSKHLCQGIRNYT